jgi:hypothetical protein
MRRWTLIRDLFALLCLWGLPVAAQTPEAPKHTAVEEPADSTTVFPHSDTGRFWVAGQVNVILQAHPDFRSHYQGENSLRAQGESKTSDVMTLYMGARVTRNVEVLADVESSGGRGISDALGLAGFTNLDVVRNPDLGPTPYLARAMVHVTVPLGDAMVESERGFLGLATKLPERRLEFRAGKLSTVDFFDVNAVGSDSHLQFLNWAIDNNGAYDYAADTRGYTYGVTAEFQDRGWGFRFGEFLMPKVANGIDLDWNLQRAHSENFELEVRPRLLRDRKTTVRLLSYMNTATMGDYRAAVERFEAELDSQPTIENTRKQATVKHGFGLSAEQELTKSLRAFLRLGWNEGRHESFAYTEVNSSLAFGVDLAGARWRRKLDKAGAAFVSDGISRDHQQYLRLGGLGFLLGDGNLNYGRENVVESYYTMHVWRGVFASFDMQYVVNPGYNRDRGPVVVPSVRLHIDL